jgi:hypothetical protein
MSATATRPSTNALDQRRLGIAMGALILAVALLVVATVARQVTIESPSVPGTVSTSVTHDSGAVTSTLRAPQSMDAITFEGGLVYTGIPYAVPADRPLNPGEIIAGGIASERFAGSGAGPRERFAR